MPIDKQTKPPTNKPITPALSSRFRTAKPPFAPRLVGSSSTPSPATLAKEAREQTLSPLSQQDQAALNENITPRSGARNTRLGTESPASPATTRRLSGNSGILGALSSAQDRPGPLSPGTPRTGQTRLARKASSPNISAARRVSSSSNVSKKDETTTKFFRANDTKSTIGVQSPKSTLSPRPLSTLSLNNRHESPRVVHSAPPSAVHGREEERNGKFVRANEIHMRAVRPASVVRKQSAASTTTTSMNTARTRSPETSRMQSRSRPRSQLTNQGSPIKTNSGLTIREPISPTKGSSFTSPHTAFSPTGPSHRRQSFGNGSISTAPTRPALHRKSASVNSLNLTSPTGSANVPIVTLGPGMEQTWISPTVTVTVQHNNLTITSPDTLSPRSASLTSSRTVGTSVTSDTDISEVSKTAPSYTSGIGHDPFTAPSQHQQTQPTPLAQAQAAAANARRERKVLDLEISNSSLLAINKTLEKELRKQSAELRRFRRLSRSGRLSLAPSHRSVSGQSAVSLGTLQEQTEDDQMSDEEDEESDTDDIDDDMSGGPEDGSEGSPDVTIAQARRRARDERRLMLDLSKHRQLLVDSQKLTQSIRKCLNISEDLIKEGTQALKYKVGIGDVKLGGRILDADDLDGDPDLDGGGNHPLQEAPRQGLLSPSINQIMMQDVDLWLTRDASPSESPDYGGLGPQEPG